MAEATATAEAGGALRVLVVHPDPDGCAEVAGLKTPDGSTIEIAGRADTVMSAMRATVDTAPDVVLIEVDQGAFDPFALAEALTVDGGDCPVVFIGDTADPQNLRRALTCGAQEYLIRPLEGTAAAEAFSDAVSRFRQRHPATQSVAASETTRPSCEVIGLVSARGGMGKSILASNLAVALKQDSGANVSLIDCAFGDAGVMLNAVPARGLVELVPVASEIDQGMLDELVREHPSGVDLYATHTRIDYLEPNEMTAECLGAVVQLLRETQRYVVVDCPPCSPGCALDFLAQFTTIVVVATGWSLLELRDTRALLEAIRQNYLSNGTQLHVVLNRCDRRDLIKLSDIEESLQQAIFAEVPNNTKLVLDSVNLGTPVILHEPNSDVGLGVRELADKLLGKEASSEKKSRRGRSLFRL